MQFRTSHRFQQHNARITTHKSRIPQREHKRREAACKLLVERLEDRTLLSAFWVTNTADSGAGSLRQAILDNDADTANTAADTIDFNIPGAGVHTIQPLLELPEITHPVVIDGYSQPGTHPNTQAVGDDAALGIELDGSLVVGDSRGLIISASGSTVRGLVINRFVGYGIHVGVNGGNVITGNFIGTDPTGLLAEDNGYGVVVGSDGNRIGTDGDGVTDLAERNLISGNGFGSFGAGAGVAIGGSFNVVAGNYIGTDATGLSALSNSRFAVFVAGDGAHSNRIGTDGHSTDDLVERNVISGNNGGVVDRSCFQVDNKNVVAGNFIGTDATGTHPLGNGAEPAS